MGRSMLMRCFNTCNSAPPVISLMAKNAVIFHFFQNRGSSARIYKGHSANTEKYLKKVSRTLQCQEFIRR